MKPFAIAALLLAAAFAVRAEETPELAPDAGRETPARTLETMIRAAADRDATIFVQCYDLDALLDHFSFGAHGMKPEEEQAAARRQQVEYMTSKLEFMASLNAQVCGVTSDGGTAVAELSVTLPEGDSILQRVTLKKSAQGWRITGATDIPSGNVE